MQLEQLEGVECSRDPLGVSDLRQQLQVRNRVVYSSCAKVSQTHRLGRQLRQQPPHYPYIAQYLTSSASSCACWVCGHAEPALLPVCDCCALAACWHNNTDSPPN
eukprot:GHRR01015754.1.p2 GENE.GHRR01015754.1~~GHRR01015754.1.p2  ORF type:complete len:105 (+),score=25.87 GHRR01015754.1:649-963(+)